MVTRDVLRVLKLYSPTARAILRTLKTSLVPINHEMHSCSYDFLYLFLEISHPDPLNMLERIGNVRLKFCTFAKNEINLFDSDSFLDC